MYQLRPYQKEASDRAVAYLTRNPKPKGGGLIVAGTGTGKSVIIADIASRLDGDVLVLQPSKEILEQNFAKLQSYGILFCSIFSASCRSKQISKITFATIGSIMSQEGKHLDLFKHFRYCIIDECDVVNPQDGQYIEFLKSVRPATIGLTATPYRLSQTYDPKSGIYGSILRFITRTRPRFFSEVIYFTQQEDMARLGYLSPLQYYPIDTIDMGRLKPNSTGQNYTDESIRAEFARTGFSDKLSQTVWRLLYNSKVPRNGILVFTKFIDEAQALVNAFPDISAIVTGDTPSRDREHILEQFKAGNIRVVANVDCLSVGFDYPELDTVVLARPTMSLRLYYQQVGRAIRPHKDKQEAWIVDLVGSYKKFGRVEDLKIKDATGTGAWIIESRGKQLTNVIMTT